MRRVFGRSPASVEEEPNVSLVERTHAARGDVETLRSLCLEAFARTSDELHAAEWTELGIALRDAGLRDESLRCLEQAIRISPTDLSSRYEIAILYLNEGRHLRCLDILREAIVHHPHDDRSNLLAARILHSIGAHRDASTHLDRVYILGPDRLHWAQQLKVLHEFGEFVARYPKSWAIQKAEEKEKSATHLDAVRVGDRVFAALKARIGFSLLRVGDGEGAFIRFGNVDEARFANLYAQNRRDRAHVWFAGAVDPNAEFLSDAFDIVRAMERADIVGIPYPSWFEHEYRILSVTGITALTNLLRVAAQPQQHTCSQLIHIDLHRTKVLYEIMRSERRIGLISCHRGLADRLRTAFGYEEVEYHHVPGEKGHGHLLSPEAISGVHWPNRYREIIQSLARPLEGRLFIVAAGILGKLYCDQIKRFGGVALDVGSLADGWMGAQTRPNFEEMPIS